jgi:hypothetical protein
LFRPTQLLAGVLAAGLSLSCSDSILGGRSGLAHIAFEPRFSQQDAAIYRSLKLFGLGVTTVHVSLRRPDSDEVLAEETVTPADDQDEIPVTLTVAISGSEELLVASLEIFSGDVLIFSGSVNVIARSTALPTAPPVLAAVWVGPGFQATNIQITPRDLSLAVNGRLTLSAVATDPNGTPIDDPDYTTRWRWNVNDPTLGTLPAAGGEFVAAGKAGVALITVFTPNLLRDTVRITLVNQLPLAKVRFARQLEVLDIGATAAGIAVTSSDANGAVIPNPVLSYVSRSPQIAAVHPATGAITGVARGQAVIIVRGQEQGATAVFEDSLLAVVAQPDSPVLISSIDRFEYDRDVNVILSIFADMRSTTRRLGSTTIDVDWNPNVLQYVSDATGASGVTPTVNALLASTGRLTLAMADVTGFAGRVELLRITFRTSATAAVGQLALTARELSAADFTDLLGATVQVTHPVAIR